MIILYLSVCHPLPILLRCNLSWFLTRIPLTLQGSMNSSIIKDYRLIRLLQTELQESCNGEKLLRWIEVLHVTINGQVLVIVSNLIFSLTRKETLFFFCQSICHCRPLQFFRASINIPIIDLFPHTGGLPLGILTFCLSSQVLCIVCTSMYILTLFLNELNRLNRVFVQ